MEAPKRKIKIVRRPNLDEWSWEDILCKYVPPTWEEVFAQTTEERKIIAQMLTTKALPLYKELYPAKENIYKAFDITPFSKIRVVIIGQDPYPNKQAQGLSFSISPNDMQIPGSLRNIYKEIKAEIPSFEIPCHGDLRKWARQGVLLLNMALTVPPGVKNAHHGVWMPFTVKTIKAIVEKRPKTIFVLWGNEAQKLVKPIGNAPTLISAHPSPMSVNNSFQSDFPFMGNKHFIKINEILVEEGEEPIDWQV